MGPRTKTRALRHAGRAGVEMSAGRRGAHNSGFSDRMPNAFIALGSNQGDPRRNVLEAMERLEKYSERPLMRSSLWETQPVDCPPGSPNFVNAVVGLYPKEEETAETLLQNLLLLEQEFGRRPKKKLNEPRPLDLDLIAFGDQIRAAKNLTLPHPRAHLRGFVLKPLTEIAPDLVLPGQSGSVSQLLKELPPDKTMRKLS